VSRAMWTDAELDRTLRGLAPAVEFPPVPALASAVAGRLRAEARPVITVPRRTWWAARRRALVTVTLSLVLVLTAVLALSPAARQAVARWLGLDGVRIRVVPTLPTVPTPSDTPTSIDHLLGDPVSLDEAIAGVDFELIVPPGLGPPDRVFLDDDADGGRVTLAYLPSAAYPASEHTGYGVLLTQFVGTGSPELTEKLVGEGSTVEPVEVNGEPGYWIGGRDHLLRYLGPNGEILVDTVRLAGPTLLWQHGELLLRLEADLNLEDALELAETIR
jgi:hypothetical protein